jgi:uncharacterized protein with HEPN domain
MQPDDETAVLDIFLCARRIADATASRTWPDFRDDISLQETVLYRLIVIGEAVKRLSAAFRTEHGEIEWQSVAGLRDILVHAYERVNLELIWSFACRDVLALGDYLEPLIPTSE